LQSKPSPEEQEPASDPFPQQAHPISSTLSSLYVDYINSIPRLVSLPSASASTTLTNVSEVSTVESKQEREDELVMSKTQVQLALDEGKFWDALATSESQSPVNVSEAIGPEAKHKKLEKLVERSRMMSMSYGRTAHPPTSETYAQSKEILRAMGVPCIESEGAVEAEALAASLVLNGHADYVASEDTVNIQFKSRF
jgi:flap endonuclease-1